MITNEKLTRALEIAMDCLNAMENETRVGGQYTIREIHEEIKACIEEIVQVVS